MRLFSPGTAILQDAGGDQAEIIALAGGITGVLLSASVKNAVVQAEEALNDSNKIITVPASTLWHVLGIGVLFTATATVGDRVVDILIRDAADDILLQFRAGIVQTASQAIEYIFIPGSLRETAAFQGVVYVPLAPDLWLPAGFDLRVRDAAGVDAAADDMDVQLLVDEYSA